METVKNQEYQTLKEMERILAGLDLNSYIAEALQKAFGKEAEGYNDSGATVGLPDELRQVRLPEEFVRGGEEAEENPRESLLRQLAEAESRVMELKARLYDLIVSE